MQPYTASQSTYSLTPGLSIGLIGSAAQISNLRPYAPPNPYVAVNVMVNLAGAGAEAYVVQYARQSVYPSVGVHGGSGAFADHQPLAPLWTGTEIRR